MGRQVIVNWPLPTFSRSERLLMFADFAVVSIVTAFTFAIARYILAVCVC